MIFEDKGRNGKSPIRPKIAPRATECLESVSTILYVVFEAIPSRNRCGIVETNFGNDVNFNAVPPISSGMKAELLESPRRCEQRAFEAEITQKCPRNSVNGSVKAK